MEEELVSGRYTFCLSPRPGGIHWVSAWVIISMDAKIKSEGNDLTGREDVRQILARA